MEFPADGIVFKFVQLNASSELSNKKWLELCSLAVDHVTSFLASFMQFAWKFSSSTGSGEGSSEKILKGEKVVIPELFNVLRTRRTTNICPLVVGGNVMTNVRRGSLEIVYFL